MNYNLKTALKILLIIGITSLLLARCEAEEIRVRDTGSMKGWLAPGGAWLHLDPVPFASVKVGDVIIYRHRKAGLVCHRVIEVHPGKVWTKGDSNREPDDQW